ncbi:hypothetical protein AMATHDRAFT_68616 [Amanita thiersii Skay4041]|uniref:SAGA-associated factor 11 n=1 Tax=Amanita thiersii Skay4041 TaxID=703135 RepID=A0A2A9NA72_9AGAR|nr:hypothetical protein AMATHDRAFT_68616 [Amanita thiersii Skay4041]
MPKSEREEAINALTARIFRAMIDDMLMDAALQSHQEISRSRAVCHVCHTRCQAVHTPGPSSAAAPSRAETPLSVDTKPTANGTGTSTPTSSAKADSSTHLECVNCNRQIAPSRYAPHLSTCMGLGTARRGAVRTNANVKVKNAEALRADSPVSETGTASDDRPNTKGKTKSKSKLNEFNLKRKRPGSPQISPNKKAKQGRPPGSGSPASRARADPDAEISGLPSTVHYSSSTGSQSKIPSKLRESSTTSLIERSATPVSSRSTSPDGVSAATPVSSSFSQSPNISARAIGNGKAIRGRATGIGPPKRPTPLPIHVPDYSLEIVDGGDETGSSTDTDSG